MLWHQLLMVDHPAETPLPTPQRHPVALLEALGLPQIVTIDHLQMLLAKALVRTVPGCGNTSL